MQILRYVLIALYILNCLAVIIITMMQNKDDNGGSGTRVGSSTNNFYERNKSRTREGKLKKWTMILGITFMILTIALGIVYVI